MLRLPAVKATAKATAITKVTVEICVYLAAFVIHFIIFLVGVNTKFFSIDLTPVNAKGRRTKFSNPLRGINSDYE